LHAMDRWTDGIIRLSALPMGLLVLALFGHWNASVHEMENTTASAATLRTMVAIPATWNLKARFKLNGMRCYSSQMRSPQSHWNMRMVSFVCGNTTALINFSLPLQELQSLWEFASKRPNFSALNNSIVVPTLRAASVRAYNRRRSELLVNTHQTFAIIGQHQSYLSGFTSRAAWSATTNTPRSS
jgi:hypothetical protein